MRLKAINDQEMWDRYIKAHGQSGYCHLFNWCRVLEDAYQCQSIYLAAVTGDAMDHERICAVLPLYRFKRPMGRARFVSIPFFDTGGILADDAACEALLLKKSAGILSGQRCAGFELRQNGPLMAKHLAVFRGPPDIYHEKVGLHLDLPCSQQKMMAGFKSKLRNQIRKGEKNGLVWQIGKRDLLDPFYRVFSRNMRDLGSPVHSKRFFDSIFTYFYHRAFICVIFYRSTPVAASFMIRFKKRLSNPWASSVRQFRYLNANMFLYWQMIRFACNTGMAVFDMGRSSKGASTYRFKKQWEPKETPLFWYRWGEPVHETLSMRPWKLLPVELANRIGPGIRRHITL